MDESEKVYWLLKYKYEEIVNKGFGDLFSRIEDTVSSSEVEELNDVFENSFLIVNKFIRGLDDEGLKLLSKLITDLNTISIFLNIAALFVGEVNYGKGLVYTLLLDNLTKSLEEVVNKLGR